MLRACTLEKKEKEGELYIYMHTMQLFMHAAALYSTFYTAARNIVIIATLIVSNETLVRHNNNYIHVYVFIPHVLGIAIASFI